MIPELREFRPVFVGGAGRSGTTLLRSMLGCHSRLFATNELKVLPDIAALRRKFDMLSGVCESFNLGPAYLDDVFGLMIYSLLLPALERSGKQRIVEKTPHNVLAMDVLGRLFPQARFVHVIRDGRDVCCSLVRMDWRDASGQRVWYTTSIRNAAKYWRDVVKTARAQARLPYLQGRYIEVRYESLVTDPKRTLRVVLDFIGEPWEDQVLDDHLRASLVSNEVRESSTEQVKSKLSEKAIGRWEKEMSPEDLKAFYEEAGELWEELGYADSLREKQIEL